MNAATVRDNFQLVSKNVDHAVAYRLKDAGDRYLITPHKQFELLPGIYSYEFDYMLDR